MLVFNETEYLVSFEKLVAIDLPKHTIKHSRQIQTSYLQQFN